MKLEVPYNNCEIQNDTATIDCIHCSGTGICSHNCNTCKRVHYKFYNILPDYNMYECRYCKGLGKLPLSYLIDTLTN